MFEDDICLCGNYKDCPHKDECLRAQTKIGIHTYSLFYREKEDCEYMIKKEDNKNA